MPKDNNHRNKLEPLRQYGVFAWIVPRTGQFIFLTPQGARPVRTFHRLSVGRRWDAGFVSRMMGIPWDVKSNAGEGIEDGTISERTEERPPDPLVELPPSMRTRRMYIRRTEVERCGGSSSASSSSGTSTLTEQESR